MGGNRLETGVSWQPMATAPMGGYCRACMEDSPLCEHLVRLFVAVVCGRGESMPTPRKNSLEGRQRTLAGPHNRACHWRAAELEPISSGNSKGALMKITWLILALGVLAVSAPAQPSRYEVLKLPYHPIRQVGEKVYSLQRIYDWDKKATPRDPTPRPMQEWIGYKNRKDFALHYRVEQVLREGLILRSSGEFAWIGEPFGYGEEYYGEGKYNKSEPILLKNYPGADALVGGQKIQFLAIRAGSFRYTGTDGAEYTIAAYDYGKPYVAPPLTAEQIATQAKANADAKAKAGEQKILGAARALQANQEAAAKGDSFGLLRMGQRYRDGDGVEKDLSKAKEYLQKAADAGSPTAAEELAKLKP